MAVESTHSVGPYRILRIVTGEIWRENCYLAIHAPSGQMALVDPGDDADSIIRATVESGTRLQHVLLTHAHHDHVGAVAALYRRFGLACEVHDDDVRLLRHAPMYALRFAQKQIETPAPFRAFKDQPTFHVGEQPVQVIHTPGHTSGSVCYNFGGFVFTGDTLLYQRVGRSDLPGGDPKLLVASVNQLLERLPGDTVVFPGHGRPWTLGEARTWWGGAAGSAPEHKQFET
jgi:hydroxyacylglutathione hydrolase